MKVEVGRLEGTLHLRFEGGDALDSACAPDVKGQALSKIDGTSDVVVDLEGIDFVDSTGVGVLVSLVKRARLSGRSVRFAGVSDGVRTVLQIIKLDRIFELYPDARMAARAGREAGDRPPSAP